MVLISHHISTGLRMKIIPMLQRSELIIVRIFVNTVLQIQRAKPSIQYQINQILQILQCIYILARHACFIAQSLSIELAVIEEKSISF